MLEQLHDRAQSAQNPGTLELSFKCRMLVGFEFKHLLRGSSPIQPRTIQLNTGAADWLRLTQTIGAVNILGSDFGELLGPSQRALPSLELHCGMASGLPQDTDFLAVPLSVLKNMVCKHCQNTNGSTHLVGKFFWNDTSNFFARCECARNPSPRCKSVAKLTQRRISGCDVAARSHEPRASVFDRFPYGAIAIGHTPGKIVKYNRVDIAVDSAAEATKNEGKNNVVPEPADSGVDVGSVGSSSQPVLDEAYRSGQSSARGSKTGYWS